MQSVAIVAAVGERIAGGGRRRSADGCSRWPRCWRAARRGPSSGRLPCVSRRSSRRLVPRTEPIGSPSPSTSATGWRSVRAGSPDAEGVDAADAIGRLADAGVTTFEVTAIDRDGLLGGPDLALYGRLIALGSGSIIASGGIATIADLVALRDLGCTGAIVGRALLDGSMDLAAAAASLRPT